MIILVLAEVPLPGRCLKALIPYNDEAWLARLSAAMLRDTLDGLENVPADRYLVYAETDEEGRRALERHLPWPWTVTTSPVEAEIIAEAIAPAADIEPLIALASHEEFVVIGEGWLEGRKPIDAVVERAIVLPPAIAVTDQPSLDALLQELQQHHERAPRTAQLAMMG